MAYAEESSSVLQRQVSDRIPLWQVPFATAGALIDCLTCPRPVTGVNTEQQVRFRDVPPPYPDVKSGMNRAFFTNIPLQEEALHRGIIYVPSEQTYTQTYAPPVRPSYQPVTVRTLGCHGTAVQTYATHPLQYAPEASNVRYQVQPMTYAVTHQGLGNHPPASSFSTPFQMLPPAGVSPIACRPMATHSVQTWEYVTTDTSLADTNPTIYPLTQCKAVQVGSMQEQEGLVEAECTGCNGENDCDLPLRLESNGHTGSADDEEHKAAEERSGSTVEERSAVIQTDTVTEKPDPVQREEIKGSTDENSGEAPKESSQEDGSIAEKELSGKAAPRVASTLSEGISTVHSSVNDTLQKTTTVEPGREWPVGFVPPQDPCDYKELRFGNNVYLMGGTFYLSDTGAYLLGLRN
ncbi:conserved hypothetical protein [Neospora caninum Liverpool]|uniref:Uncharacterized protein n=1 Tax=Neospora caninum (strain Liverpool) TaxID=572307 RepID=F0VIY8_NEOCL|nr:conserved hypothetical protein [Neospora caninum Liverpool]CBZ53699.1 conserved hypothetical protein [Neospora caninum Liverpool]CEL67689.1 TPA: hypothetical protein BN1204_034800 [Neospora caninum Liverpool]|eukprot:XP_003883731.1 conserved hypothetical protein [Neospora caninum Liverpool]